MESGNKNKEVPIGNFRNFSANFGNCRHGGDVNIKGGKKPELLLEFIINKFSSVGDIVLDYHLGSGSTCCSS
ncbi:MAG: site-specific DNA-methyltransferase [Deltaproteobacteria bacterium]|nr:site-specific DNA-methyltransferase [Deltaproteobacteria bacterium]